MIISKKAIAASILAACGLLSLASVSSARTLGGFAGRSLAWSDNACFAESWGTTTNTCGSMKYWRTFPEIDNSGNHTFTVNAYGAAAANNVGCAAYGMTEDGSGYWGGTYVYLPSFGANKRISVGTVYAPSYGYMFLDCQVNAGGRVNSIQWNP
jgi:hypothetical protein